MSTPDYFSLIVEGEDVVRCLAFQCVWRGWFFIVSPQPNDEFQVTVRCENRRLLKQLVRAVRANLLAGLDIQIEDGLSVTIELDTEEAKGKLVIRCSPYGLTVACSDVHPEPLALLDLYYGSPAAPVNIQPPKKFNIILYSPAEGDRSVACAGYIPQARLVFDRDTRELGGDEEQGWRVFGLAAEQEGER